MKPRGIQLRRVKGWRMPPNTVSVARPGKWGNPCHIGMWKNYTAADAVRDYKRWIDRDPGVRSYENAFGEPPTKKEIRRELRGKNLACFCPLDQPCHRNVLLKIANA